MSLQRPVSLCVILLLVVPGVADACSGVDARNTCMNFISCKGEKYSDRNFNRVMCGAAGLGIGVGCLGLLTISRIGAGACIAGAILVVSACLATAEASYDTGVVACCRYHDPGNCTDFSGCAQHDSHCP